MKYYQSQILFSALAIGFLIAFLIYGHHVVTDITNTFAEGRISEANIISNLIRDNWDGINSISDEKKKILIENLDPNIAATDIRTLGQIILILVYLIGAGFIIGRIVAIGKVLWTMRYNKSLKNDARERAS